MTLPAATRLMSAIFALCGILSVAAALLNPDWFFRSANVRLLTLGARRPVARLIYAIFGLLMLAAAYRLWLDASELYR